MLGALEQTGRSLRWSVRVCAFVIASATSMAFVPSARAQSARRPDGPLIPVIPVIPVINDRQLEQTQREEGEAILAMADAAMAGRTAPSDFRVGWQNDFVKAQRGTFVPFTLTIDASLLGRRLALVYVRATRRAVQSPGDKPARGGKGDSDRDRAPEEAAYPVDAIFPVELPAGEASRISRGFSVAPGVKRPRACLRNSRSPRIKPADFASLYEGFNAPVSRFDCGRKCAPLNDGEPRLLLDPERRAGGAQGRVRPAEDPHRPVVEVQALRLRHQADRGRADQRLHGHPLQGRRHCERDNRTIACRGFPFYPYITRERQFVGVGTYWVFEDRCWMMSNLEIVDAKFVGNSSPPTRRCSSRTRASSRPTSTSPPRRGASTRAGSARSRCSAATANC